MKTKHKITIIVVVILVIVGLYFISTPFSITRQLVLSTFKESTLQEFESLEEIKLLKSQYDITRTGEDFNAFQSHFANFYYAEPNGILKPPFINIVVIKDLISGKIHMVGVCTPESSTGYRLEQRQILPYLQEFDCFEDKWINQKTLDEEIPPFSIVYRGSDEILDDGKVIDVMIPFGISDSEQLDLDPSIFTVMIGKNNTVRWTNHDDSSSTLYSENPAWTTGIIEPGKSAVLTFNDPGVYKYHGYYHSWKDGMIVVLED